MSTRHQYGQDDLTKEGYEAKAEIRARTLALIRDSDYFVEDYLNGDVLDLCGEHDETLQGLLDTNVLRPGLSTFIGVNDNGTVIRANEEYFKEVTDDGRAVWVESTWASAVADLERFPRVRVINFDSCNRLNNKQIDAILHTSLALAAHLYRRNGTVLLVLNFTVGRMADRDKAAQKYIRRLRAWRNKTNPGNRTKLEFHQYTSKKMPMLNVWLPMGF